MKLLSILTSRSFSFFQGKSSQAIISTLFQCCLLVGETSRGRTTSNQNWNNVVYVNLGIYNVEQLRINFVYFNVDINNVTQWQNKPHFQSRVSPRWSMSKNVVKITISKKNNNNNNKKKKNIPNSIHWIQNFNYYLIIFFTLLPMLRWRCQRVLTKSQKFLKDYEKFCTSKT